jgi:hypothetical protein
MRQSMSAVSTVFASAAVGLALIMPAFAQAPGGGGGRMPFAFGTVSSTDATANTITITTRNGDSQVVKMGGGATITTETAVAITDLKVGDQVEVQGIPTGITASTLTAGTPPQGLPGAGGFGERGFGGPGGGGPGGGNGQAPAVHGDATADGTIQTLPTANDAHLAIMLGPDATLYVKMAPDAKINRYSTENLSDLKAGDRIIATGTTGDDGTLTATSVGVNMPQGNFGGFGGRGGRGRRGGGGAPPPAGG